MCEIGIFNACVIYVIVDNVTCFRFVFYRVGIVIVSFVVLMQTFGTLYVAGLSGSIVCIVSPIDKDNEESIDGTIRYVPSLIVDEISDGFILFDTASGNVSSA